MYESIEAATEAGLLYTSDCEPGIRRVRRGRGFSYIDKAGERLSGMERERIEDLVIPPAWTDVWICCNKRGHLQATGRDHRGRKQYLYHGHWREVRDEAKFDNLVVFGEGLPKLRNRVEEDLRSPGLSMTRVVAAVLSLLDKTLIRVGNEEYRRENGTYGLTTLEPDHVEISGSELSFHFIGKGGLEHEVDLRDKRLARVVRSCHELGGRELFTYRGPDGEPLRVDSSDANDYLSEVMGESMTVKNFRTWGASVIVAEELLAADDPDDKAVLAAIDTAADRLGNTRTVCRNSYVHPRVLSDAASGALREAWDHSRSTDTMTRSERTLLKLLSG